MGGIRQPAKTLPVGSHADRFWRCGTLLFVQPGRFWGRIGFVLVVGDVYSAVPGWMVSGDRRIGIPCVSQTSASVSSRLTIALRRDSDVFFSTEIASPRKRGFFDPDLAAGLKTGFVMNEKSPFPQVVGAITELEQEIVIKDHINSRTTTI